MKHFFVVLIQLLVIVFTPNPSVSVSGIQKDHLALMKFNESISNDPNRILLSWNSSIHLCNWHGITCSRIHQRVTELNLQGYKLNGSISPHIGNLSFLRNLNLQDNNLFGEIPRELGRLFRLQQLSLTSNSLSGEIPTTLTNCSNLEWLDIGSNKLTGKIPHEFGTFRKLQVLRASTNNLTGGISPFIGNLSSLTSLSLAVNNLEGRIPQEICYLKNLTKLGLGPNKFSGTFPSCVYNMSSLTVLSIPNNQFHGSLPSNLFHTLPNIQLLFIGGNKISGPIPNSLTNASFLQKLDIGGNQFVGQVPRLWKLQHLEVFRLEFNNLGNNSNTDLHFLKSLTNCSNLQLLQIGYNNFGGSLPNSIGNLSSQLRILYLGVNEISGKIPTSIGNLNNLIALGLENNNFDGIVPATFGKLQKMQSLGISGNKLSGGVPAFIWNLSQLFQVSLANNMFEGTIPPCIGNCPRLQHLDLSQNNLTGTIPFEIFNLSSLTTLLNLSQNSLSGSLPDNVGRLKYIGQVDVSENNLSGDIPRTIGECTNLEYLYLQRNFFHGIIPSSLASLKGLLHLDLSRNNLSGPIPIDLQNISGMEYLNVSFNMLEGMVPTEGIFQNISELSVNGNSRLCGGVPKLHLPPCLVKSMKPIKHRNLRLIVATIICVISFLLILLIISTIYCMRKRNKKLSSDSLTIDQLPKVSYKDLHHATDGFSARNLIGSGSFGSVYKGPLMSEDKVVAIKVLNLGKKGARKSFIVECNALKNIRHRNLVKILSCCSSLDYNGQEFKALVFEYMTNGSLEQWLHLGTLRAEQPRTLDLHQRLNIICDISSALHYLHLECEQAVVHCDLKPSNVLLDDDMVAHVGDFGIARILSTINGTSHMQSSTIGIKGTVGYAPPEYGVGSEVTTQGEMYSFGILVLEMVTSRRPTDEMFEDGQNLHNFVKDAFPNNILQVVDSIIVPSGLQAAIEQRNEENLTIEPNVEKCLVSLCRIGLACSVESPKDRMNIADATSELNKIKMTFCVGRMPELRQNQFN